MRTLRQPNRTGSTVGARPHRRPARLPRRIARNLQRPAQAHRATRTVYGLPVTRVWSRRWVDDADPGTIVYLDNGARRLLRRARMADRRTRDLALRRRRLGRLLQKFASVADQIYNERGTAGFQKNHAFPRLASYEPRAVVGRIAMTRPNFAGISARRNPPTRHPNPSNEAASSLSAVPVRTIPRHQRLRLRAGEGGGRPPRSECPGSCDADVLRTLIVHARATTVPTERGESAGRATRHRPPPLTSSVEISTRIVIVIRRTINDSTQAAPTRPARFLHRWSPGPVALRFLSPKLGDAA